MGSGTEEYPNGIQYYCAFQGNSLYEQRLITKEEYDEKRKEFLKEF